MRHFLLASIAAIVVLVGCESSTSSDPASTVDMNSTLDGKGVHWRLAKTSVDPLRGFDTGVQLPDSAIDCQFVYNYLLYPDSSMKLWKYHAFIAEFQASTSRDSIHFCLESNNPYGYYCSGSDGCRAVGLPRQSACTSSRLSPGFNRVRIPLDSSLRLGFGWQFGVIGPKSYTLDTMDFSTQMTLNLDSFWNRKSSSPTTPMLDTSSMEWKDLVRDTLKGFRFTLER